MLTYFIDIDKTLADTEGTDYENSRPRLAAIDKVNQLYAAGNRIVIWTSRGMAAHEKGDLDECNRLHLLTMKQLKSWGLKFHKLRVDKPIFDVLVDDKAINARDF